MTSGMNEETDNFYTLVPEQGLCLVGDDIINLRKVVLIRHVEGKTLLYYAGVPQPVALAGSVFEKIRESVFAVDDIDDEDFDEDE